MAHDDARSSIPVAIGIGVTSATRRRGRPYRVQVDYSFNRPEHVAVVRILLAYIAAESDREQMLRRLYEGLSKNIDPSIRACITGFVRAVEGLNSFETGRPDILHGLVCDEVAKIAGVHSQCCTFAASVRAHKADGRPGRKPVLGRDKEW